MSWIEKAQPTPFDDLPLPGLFFLDGDILARRIGRKTGGIEPDSFAHQVRADGSAVVWQFLRGKATVPQTPELLAILRDVLLKLLDHKLKPRLRR